MDRVAIGTSGLKGWRAKVADVVAPPLAAHSPMREEQIRAAVGVVFLALALLYVARALRDVLATG